MAFCSKCGTQIQDGAKFCPKCGQPTSNAGDVQKPATYNSFDDHPEEETIKTWQKVVSVLFWPAGVILVIVALIKKQSAIVKSALVYTAIGIGLAIALNLCLGGCSTDMLNAIEETVDSETSDVEEAGYNDGYEFGFEAGSEFYDEGTPSIGYSVRYGAPSTPEEKQLYKLYENAYKKGFQDGRKAKE